jgi:uncharacterized membrane protein YedE/YeeE
MHLGMENFTPIASAVGGGLIGLSAAVLLLMNGKIAGISGIAGGLLGPPTKGDGGWRMAFLFGLLVAGAVGAAVAPASLVSSVSRSSGAIIAAGLLVGLGTRIGNGCTSGHGVCGLSRMSGRSIVATATFMFTAGVTVFVTNHVLGGVL